MRLLTSTKSLSYGLVLSPPADSNGPTYPTLSAYLSGPAVTVLNGLVVGPKIIRVFATGDPAKRDKLIALAEAVNATLLLTFAEDTNNPGHAYNIVGVMNNWRHKLQYVAGLEYINEPDSKGRHTQARYQQLAAGFAELQTVLSHDADYAQILLIGSALAPAVMPTGDALAAAVALGQMADRGNRHYYAATGTDKQSLDHNAFQHATDVFLSTVYAGKAMWVTECGIPSPVDSTYPSVPVDQYANALKQIILLAKALPGPTEVILVYEHMDRSVAGQDTGWNGFENHFGCCLVDGTPKPGVFSIDDGTTATSTATSSTTLH